ncbi:MAG: MFS transporter [Hydrogenophaga sp.]|nr:MFS transporter [Hydrogenophaga sp.]
MSGQKFGVGGGIALVIGNFSGMLDLIALPVWIGGLVERYHFAPQEAGAMVTLFLLGAVLASAAVAPRFDRLNKRLIAACGFTVAAGAFLVAAHQTAFMPLIVLHLISGVAIGAALSMVHGTIGRAENPHRYFALAGIVLGFFAIVLLGAIPQLLIAFGGQALFLVFTVVMTVAALSCFFLFPHVEGAAAHERRPFSRATWYTIVAISLMTFNQAMVFSFVEVIGKARGFAPENVLAVLIALGFVNFLIPYPLSAFLQTRISATKVTQIGPAVQAILAILVTSATTFYFWAPAAAFFVSLQLFTHNFAFGRLAKIEPSGRAVAATPAMVMVGATLGPIAGGVLGQNFGYSALGMAAVCVSALTILFYTRAADDASLVPVPQT